MTPRIRHIQDGDWAAIAGLEASAYAETGLAEGELVLESRASAATSFVVDTGGAIAGYVLALPYPRFRYPDLNQPEVLAFQSSNLHLHDLVIGEEFRGTGLAKDLLHRLTEDARSLEYRQVSLIAVTGSADFWSARGYHGHPELALPSGYGAAAVYMSRQI